MRLHSREPHPDHIGLPVAGVEASLLHRELRNNSSAVLRDVQVCETEPYQKLGPPCA